MGFLKNFQKTASKNMKRFSAYPLKTERTSSFSFRKTVNSLLIFNLFWFFKKQVKEKHTFHRHIHLILTVGICLHVLDTCLAK